MQNIKQQLKSLRNTVLQMSYDSKTLYFSEIGYRGDCLGDSGKLSAQISQIVNDGDIHMLPQSDGKIFDEVKTEIPISLEGPTAGMPFVTGSLQQIDQLVRLVASPATKYIHKYLKECDARPDSLQDKWFILDQWIAVILEIGRRMDDPNLQRCSRLLTALTLGKRKNDNTQVIVSPCMGTITKEAWDDKSTWSAFIEAIKKYEIAYSTLGTDLVVASRIALDHLVEKFSTNLAKDLAECLAEKGYREAIDFTWIRMQDWIDSITHLRENDGPSKTKISLAHKKGAIAKRKKQTAIELHADSFKEWLRSEGINELDIDDIYTEAIRRTRERMKRKA